MAKAKGNASMLTHQQLCCAGGFASTTVLVPAEPPQVVFVDSVGPSDVAGWQDEGKRCFAAKQYKDAAAAYDTAMELMQQQKQENSSTASLSSSSSSSSMVPPPQAPTDGALLLQLLLNLSAAHHKLQQPLQSLAYALVAVTFSKHKSSKAFYRLALAVDALAAQESLSGTNGDVTAGSGTLAAAAAALMLKCIELMPSVMSAADKEKYMAQLTSRKPDSKSGSHTSGTTGKGGGKKAGKAGLRKPDGSTGDKSAAWGAVCSIIGHCLSRVLLCGHGIAATALAAKDSAAVNREATASHTSGQAAATNGASSESRHSKISAASATPSVALNTSSVSAAALKELANDAFRAGDSQAALQQYQAALHHQDMQQTLSQAAVLLSNRSACWLQMGGQHLLQQAGIDAAAAVMLDRSQVKPFHRSANALLQLRLLPAAAEVCQLGLQVHPVDNSLLQLQTRISLAPNSSSTASKPSDNPGSCTAASKQDHTSTTTSTNVEFISEREWARMKAAESCDAEQLSMLNTLAGLATQFGKPAPGKQNMQLVDERIPPFHEEFSKAGR